MRIQRLDLIAYGPFTDISLDLCEGTEGLHLIYGDNEAGKSTSLRALLGWLFGIAPRTSDHFVHSYGQLRIGGTLRLGTGEELQFVRKKGNKGTLLTPGTEEVLDDGVLLPFLAGIDEALFTRLHGLDHERLVQGGQEILEQSGDLGEALFSAAMGTAGLRGVLEELQSEADGLFKPRAQNMTVNRALARYRDARKMVKEASLPASEWTELRRSLSQTEEELETVRTEMALLGGRKSRLERLKRVVGPLGERRAVLLRLQELEGVLLLPTDFREQRKAVQSDLRNVQTNRDRAEKKLAGLRVEAQALDLRPEFLENQEAIESLHKELGAVEQAVKDRPQQDGQRRLRRNEARKHLKGIRPDLDLESAEELRTDLNNRKWLTGLAERHALLVQKEEQGTDDVRELAGELEELTAHQEALGPPGVDISKFKEAVALVRRDGDIEKRHSSAIHRAKSEQKICLRDLRRLGRFEGTIEEFSGLAFPASETLDQFDGRQKKLDERSREHGRKQADITGESEEIGRELAELLSSGDVPSMQELVTARGRRDDGWRLVRRKYIDGEELSREEARGAKDEDLPSAYEQHVETADGVADRLRLDADRVQKRTHLEARLGLLETRLATTDEEAQVDLGQREKCDAEWRDVWTPLRIEPGSPAEMKLWLVKAEKLLERIDSTTEAQEEAGSLSSTCQAHLELLLAQWEALDGTAIGDSISLGDLLMRCEARIKREEDTEGRRAELERSLADSRMRSRRAREKQEETIAARARWRDEWSRAIHGLGLDADVHPEKATGTMERLVEFFEKLDEAEEHRRRLYGIDQGIREFEEKVVEFTDKIGRPRTDKDATVVAGQLYRELSQAREARASFEKIDRQIRETAKEAEEAVVSIRTMRDKLAAFCTQAAVENEDGLEVAEELSDTRRTLQEKLGALTGEIIRNSDGLGLDDVQKEAEDIDADALGAELERVDIEIGEFHATRDQLRDRRRTILNEIDSKDGSTTAAEACAEAEQELAVIVSGTEQYLRVKIASLILEQQIEKYRRENQTPLLVRAGELFSRLTLSSFGGLRDELDDRGSPVLLGIRRDNREVTVGGMSEGTRDQLFLALRLATLEQHLEKQEPMPFIVDDILIGFDDDRTTACLEVLKELSRKTQVLVFTHHRRVVESAGKMSSDAGILVHELQRV